MTAAYALSVHDAPAFEERGPTLRPVAPTDGPVGGEANAAALEALAIIGGDIDTLSVTIADLNGTVADVSADLAGQSTQLGELSEALSRVASANHVVDEVTRDAIDLARNSHDGLSRTSASIAETLTTAVRDLTGMASASTRLTGQLDTVVSDLKAIQGFSETIQSIAVQTQLLAINAGIMAARAGQEGKGFAVIAENVKQLADKTSATSRDVIGRLGTLSGTVETLHRQSRDNGRQAAEALDRTGRIETEMRRFSEFTGTVSTLIERIESLEAPLSTSIRLVGQAQGEAQCLDQGVGTSAGTLRSLTGQFDHLVGFAEDLIGHVAASGLQTADTPLIARCVADAALFGERLEAALASGQISMDRLFDETYREIAGSDPVQVTTGFTALFDRIAPAIQEAMLTVDPRVVFCAAIDRNGYIPTHNNKYSHPQGDDPVWNAASCRNRRLFQDRTGLAAGRNTRPFLLQTYRRDMGGGVFHLMKDLSAPIRVRGRHWGGLRIGFKPRA